MPGDVQVLDRFADKEQISPWALGSCAGVVAKGIVVGINDGSENLIEPGKTATRAQAVIMLARMAGITADEKR